MMTCPNLSVLLFFAVVISSSVARNHACSEEVQQQRCINCGDNRVYFNQDTGRCAYTDSVNTCTTGPNSFPSSVECTTQCVCQLPPEPIKCRVPPSNLFQKYFFNTQTGSCEPFPTENGNCSANSNFFLAKYSCTQLCVCELPADPGNGSQEITSFFFNSKRFRCEEFKYTGKGGNSNRFATLQDCRSSACFIQNGPPPF